MNISINGNAIDFQIENEKTVGEILGSLESECEKSGMTITSVVADGKDISADLIDAFFARPIGDVGVIDLKTISGSDIRERVRELGGTLSQYAPSLREVPVLLQTGNDLKVMEVFNDCSTALHTLYQFIPLLSLAGLTERGPSIDGIPLAEYPSQLSPILRDLLEALEKKDTILVGDLSEYELAPRIEILGAALSAL